METKEALKILSALSQETRLTIFRRLIEWAPDGANAGAIAQDLRVPAATLSFHLKELAHAGLVESLQEGRFVRYRANLGSIPDLVGYLMQNCCGDPTQCTSVGVERRERSRNSAAS